MKIKPLGDRVLVKPHAVDEVTKSGIVLPDTADKEQKEQGEVVAIGSGSELKKLKLNVGDIVVFGKYSGEEIEMESPDGGPSRVEYKFLKAEDVLGIIEN